jgi:hypothetical protein
MKHKKGVVGALKNLDSPEQLYELFEDYLDWISLNPIELVDYVGRDAHKVIRRHYHPPTWQGFEGFLFDQGIISNLENYRYNFQGRYTEYVGIIRVIRSKMFQMKFAGAAVRQYDQNIIARELGLTDKREIQNFQRPILEGGQELPED